MTQNIDFTHNLGLSPMQIYLRLASLVGIWSNLLEIALAILIPFAVDFAAPVWPNGTIEVLVIAVGACALLGWAINEWTIARKYVLRPLIFFAIVAVMSIFMLYQRWAVGDEGDGALATRSLYLQMMQDSFFGSREPVVYEDPTSVPPPELVKRVADAKTALTVWTREDEPQQWAKAQENLGDRLQELAAHGVGYRHLDEALEAYRSALKVWTRNRSPLDWTRIMASMGAAASTLRDRGASSSYADEAVFAYHAAAEIDPKVKEALAVARVRQEELKKAHRQVE